MRDNSSKHQCMIVFNEYPLGETRVQREAETLLRNGYEVDVICKRMPGEMAVDNYKGVQIYREKFHFQAPFLKSEGLGQRLLDYLRFFFSARAGSWQHSAQPIQGHYRHSLTAGSGRKAL